MGIRSRVVLLSLILMAMAFSGVAQAASFSLNEEAHTTNCRKWIQSSANSFNYAPQKDLRAQQETRIKSCVSDLMSKCGAYARNITLKGKNEISAWDTTMGSVAEGLGKIDLKRACNTP